METIQAMTPYPLALSKLGNECKQLNSMLVDSEQKLYVAQCALQNMKGGGATGPSSNLYKYLFYSLLIIVILYIIIYVIIWYNKPVTPKNKSNINQ